MFCKSGDHVLSLQSKCGPREWLFFVTIFWKVPMGPSASPKNSSAYVDITSIFANKHLISGKNHTKDFREATFDRALKQTGNKFAKPSAKRKALSLEA